MPPRGGVQAGPCTTENLFIEFREPPPVSGNDIYMFVFHFHYLSAERSDKLRAGSEPPQTGHTFSVGLIIRLALHLEHLTGWSLTRLISSGSRVLLIWFFLFPVNVFGPTEIFRDRIVTVAVPAKELFFTWGPGEVFVSARALRRVIGRGCFFLFSCHCPSYFLEDSFSYFFRRS